MNEKRRKMNTAPKRESFFNQDQQHIAWPIRRVTQQIRRVRVWLECLQIHRLQAHAVEPLQAITN